MRESILRYTTQLALAAALLLTGQLLRATPDEAAVVGPARAVDGDTLAIGDARVRLEGIDAPETAQTCGRPWAGTWPCGEAATRHLAKLVDGREVRCASRGADKYGRMLAVCTAAGVELNAEMVRQGLAWAFVKYSQSYVAVEAEARALRVGIWQGDAVPPWEFRARAWTSVEPAAPGGCAIKGNVTKNGRIYHMPWSPWYHQVQIDADKGKRWFCSEAEAVAAGWRPALTR